MGTVTGLLAVRLFGILAAVGRRIVVYLISRREAPKDGRRAAGTVGSADFHDCARIPLGPGDDFDFDIVGEASYLARLKQIAGPRLEAGEKVVVPLLVVPEPNNPHDSNAIKVVFEGLGTVGYFSRDDAEDWKDVAQALISRRAVGTCEGRLVGGTREKPNIGVRLSLKDPDELLDMLK